jgi:2-phospho-L-lactate/phosphoenolpyruvate guanylyltransferase
VKTLAILPVKSFGAAKQRLAESLGAGSRQALAQAMFTDVLAALRRADDLDQIAVITSDRVAESATRGRGRVVVLEDTVQAGHSQAAAIGIRYALEHGFDRVVLVPSDTPLLLPADLAELLSRSAAGVSVVPDRHGTGTNALVLSPPDAIEPSFGPGSRARHVALAEEARVPVSVEEVAALALDVDTPEDLAALSAELEQRRGQAPYTRGALRQLDRAGAAPVRASA